MPKVIERPGVFRDRNHRINQVGLVCDVWVSNRKFQKPQIVHQCTLVGRMNVRKCIPNGPSTLASASLVQIWKDLQANFIESKGTIHALVYVHSHIQRIHLYSPQFPSIWKRWMEQISSSRNRSKKVWLGQRRMSGKWNSLRPNEFIT